MLTKSLNNLTCKEIIEKVDSPPPQELQAHTGELHQISNMKRNFETHKLNAIILFELETFTTNGVTKYEIKIQSPPADINFNVLIYSDIRYQVDIFAMKRRYRL